MVSKRLQQLLSELGLEITGVSMGPQTLQVSVTLTSKDGTHHVGKVEKTPGKAMRSLDMAVGEALSANYPGWTTLWYRYRGIEKKDRSGEVLEVVC